MNMNSRKLRWNVISSTYNWNLIVQLQNYDVVDNPMKRLIIGGVKATDMAVRERERNADVFRFN